MSKRDLYSNVDVSASLTPAALDADTNGIGVDLKGSGSAMVIVNVGVEGVTLSTGNRIEIELEESDDNAVWTDVEGADIQGASSGTLARYDDSAELPDVKRFGYLGTSRYIRVVANFTGTHGSATPMSAVVVRGNLALRPADA